MNTVIELHDSELVEVSGKDGEVTLQFAPVYLHKSTGRPGIDPGTGWVQDARLLFTNAKVTGGAPELPFSVWNGDLVVGSETLANCIPVPLNFDGEVELRLVFGPEHTLAVKGQSVRLELLDQPRYVEEFPWRNLGVSGLSPL